MPGVDTHTPLYLGVSTGYQITVINTGNQGVYYQAASKGGTISASVNDGQIAVGATLIVGYPIYLLGAGAGAQVDPSVTAGGGGVSVAQKQLIQLAIIAEVLAEGVQPRVASLDYPSNTAGL